MKQKMNTWDWFIEMPDRFKTKDLCEKVVQEVIDMFEYVPNELKTQEMCERAVEIGHNWFFDFVPEQFRTQAMCESVIGKNIYFFNSIPDKFKTKEMCERAVETAPRIFFEDVPDYFVTPKILELCKNAIAEDKQKDYQDAYQTFKMMACIEEYKDCKYQKARIKEELLPIAWHPD